MVIAIRFVSTPEDRGTHEFIGQQLPFYCASTPHQLSITKITIEKQLWTHSKSFSAQLTGNPIQNNMEELWTLLHFINPADFESLDDFKKKYGDIKSKDRVDESHETIRPYILRRLKEDVENYRSGVNDLQKQYYRAPYEKNLTFLHRNKKPLDGPSINNLAPWYRKHMMKRRTKMKALMRCMTLKYLVSCQIAPMDRWIVVFYPSSVILCTRVILRHHGEMLVATKACFTECHAFIIIEVLCVCCRRHQKRGGLTVAASISLETLAPSRQSTGILPTFQTIIEYV